MVEYKCPRCKKEFNKKFNYNRHLNRKNICTKNNEEYKLMQSKLKILKLKLELSEKEKQLLIEKYKNNN